MGNAKQAKCRVQSCCFAPCYFAWHLSPPEEAPPPALLLLHRSREDASPVLRQTRVTDAPPRVTVATRMSPSSFAKLPIPTPAAVAGKEESALPVPLKTRVKAGLEGYAQCGGKAGTKECWNAWCENNCGNGDHPACVLDDTVEGAVDIHTRCKCDVEMMIEWFNDDAAPQSLTQTEDKWSESK